MTGLVKHSLQLLHLNLPVLSEPARSPGFSFEQPSADYVALSKQLGVNTIPLRLCELAQIVREETLGIYPYQDVASYLDQQAAALSQGKVNRWKTYEWRWRPVKSYSSSSYYRHGSSSFSSEVYDKPIPREVLPTIARIVKRMPEAEFYVSDVEQFQDPFLAVTVPGSDTLFVIERWDEPSFR
jgi:hypothetical protein